METLKKVPYTPVFVTNCPELNDMVEGYVYISEEYKCAIHKCLCGCGKETVTPLGGGRNWELVKENNGTVSFLGSVFNRQSPCQSHYIMTKNIANVIGFNTTCLPVPFGDK